MIKSFIKKNYIMLIIFSVMYILLNHNKTIDNFIKNEISFKVYDLVKFKSITKNMSEKKLSSFSIYYDGILGEDDISFITTTIEKSEDSINNILGITNSYPLNIVLFSSKDNFYSAFKLNSGTTSIYANNVIYLSIDTMIEHMVIHEYNHYKFDGFCKDKGVKQYKIPSWFNEGLAEYNTYMSMFPDETLEGVQIDKLKSLKDLSTPSDISKAGMEGYLPYVQSYLAIKKIIDINGVNVIRDILIDSKSMNFYDSLKKNTNMNIEEIEQILPLD